MPPMPLKRSRQRILGIISRYIESHFSLEAPGDPNIPMSTAVCSVSCNLRADAATRTLQNRRASTVRQNGIDNTILSIPESGLKEEEMKAHVA